MEGYYFNSWKLIPANVIWGALFLLTFAVLLYLPLAGLLLFLFVLPFPTAGLFRLAALIQRGEPSHVSDALAWRTFGRRALGTGLVVGGVSVVFGYNIVVGLTSLDLLGWAFATAAFWGLIVVWLVAAALWPLLFDPQRENEPSTALIRLALVVVLVKPIRYLLLMGALGVILIVSTILFVALITISIAYFALAMASYAIPMADRIEGRHTFVVTS